MSRLLFFAAVLVASAASAQTWEQIPPPSDYGNPLDNIEQIAFLPGAQAEGSLFSVGQLTLRYDPEIATDPELYPWVHRPVQTSDATSQIFVTTAGTLLAGGIVNWLGRSTERGETWEYENVLEYGLTGLFQTSLPSLIGPDGHGAIFGSPGRSAVRSLHDGARGTWETLGAVGGDPIVFGEAPPSQALPAGRLLAGVYNGLTYSDDGGVTWQPSQGAYGFAEFIGYSLAFVPDPGHPYGGVALAGVDDLALGRDSSATIYRSEDGGASWVRTHRFSPTALGLDKANRVVLTTTGDGVVWAGVTHMRGGSADNSEAIVLRSVDGGVTWDEGGLRSVAIRQLLEGPDRRLYAATANGVWRTAVALYAVSEEDAPEAASVSVSVYPNPTGGPVTVSVALAAPMDVAITVVDVQGRVVQETYRGGATDGQRFAIDTADWASGTYVVHVDGERQSVTASFTLTR